MALQFFTLVNGAYSINAQGQYVIDLLKQQHDAYVNNADNILAWFKGINVEPIAENVLEFADELQEYTKYTGKKSIWDTTPPVVTSQYIKWNYYAQAPRPDKYVVNNNPSTIVNNIVDDVFIEDRILRLQSNTTGFVEYVQRDTTFTYNDVFSQTNGSILAGYQSNFTQGFDPLSTTSREEVLAWFKGVNLQPTQECLDAYKKYIQAYLLDPRKEIDTNIDIGIFINKS